MNTLLSKPKQVSKKTINTKGLHRLIKLFYEFTNLPKQKDKDAINIGYTLPIDNHNFVIHLMDKWVAWKEAVLDKIPQGTPRFADALGKRGFTLGEYKLVASGKIKEEYYKDYRVFDYLYLTNQAEREYFTGINTRKESELQEAYIEAIGESIKLEIPLLYNFLFKTKIPINIKRSSLRLHSYILGMSGSGKSTLIKNIIYNFQLESQKKQDKTILLLEPHGDLSIETIRFCLNRGKYKKRLVYLDPFISDTAIRLFDKDIFNGKNYSFTINPFQTPATFNQKDISYLTQELATAFFDILESETTTQMQSILLACIEVLLRKDNTSISDLKLMMDDAHNENLVEWGKSSPNVEVARLMERLNSDNRLNTTKSAIYYRIQRLIGDSTFRELLVGKSTIDVEQIINSGKVVVCNFSKSKLGADGASAFGKLFIALLQGLVMKRQDYPMDKRVETYFFIDEFQNFTTTSTTSTILSEARKYKLYLTLANQTIQQGMERSTKRAILSNTSLKFSGDNEPDSLEAMAKSMGDLKIDRFNNLSKYSFFYHDRLNKKAGVNVLRVPDFLVHQNSPFYMKKGELMDVFKYLVYESGYYKEVTPIVAPLTLTSEVIPLKTSKGDSKPSPIYDVNFDEE